MSRRNHSPERTCLGCMARDAQAAMVRLAAVRGAVRVDDAHRLGGRGGYLHPRRECMDGFVRGRTREFRSLRIALDRSRRESITQMLQERLDSEDALE